MVPLGNTATPHAPARLKSRWRNGEGAGYSQIVLGVFRRFPLAGLRILHSCLFFAVLLGLSYNLHNLHSLRVVRLCANLQLTDRYTYLNIRTFCFSSRVFMCVCMCCYFLWKLDLQRLFLVFPCVFPPFSLAVVLSGIMTIVAQYPPQRQTVDFKNSSIGGGGGLNVGLFAGSLPAHKQAVVTSHPLGPFLENAPAQAQRSTRNQIGALVS